MRKFAIGVALTGLLAGTLLAVAAPASAEPVQVAGRGDCDFTEYCMYEHENANGGIVAVPGNIPDYSAWVYVIQGCGCPTFTSLNDSITSYRNNGQNAGSTVVHSYRHSHQRDELWKTGIGGVINTQGWQNDQASSHNWQRS